MAPTTTINVHSAVINSSDDSCSAKLSIIDLIEHHAYVSMHLGHLMPLMGRVDANVNDFFVIASCVYGIDRFISRRKNSVDGWSRKLAVTFPVTNVVQWNEVKSELEKTLSFLTGDYWTLSFTQSSFVIPEKALPDSLNAPFSQVSLFSGGLDSFIGAIDFLSASSTSKVLFVSHYDSQMGGPKSDQEKLLKTLEKEYPKRFEHFPSVMVSLENSSLVRETTFRSRSILFIALALIAAQATKTAGIIVPENGTVSLNYPLSPSRRSACSTRTTHPTLISMIRGIWQKLGVNTTIDNPYEFKTKGEMVVGCCNPDFLKKVVEASNSCGKRGHRAHWETPNATHCGVCMPCIYRQASLQSLSDKTEYGNNINNFDVFKHKKRQDFEACLNYLHEPLTKDEIKNQLLVNGVRNLEYINKYVDVVVRTRDELKSWIQKKGNRVLKDRAGIV